MEAHQQEVLREFIKIIVQYMYMYYKCLCVQLVKCMMIVLLLLTAVGRWREPTGCRNHSTAVVGEEVYLWAGWQPGLPSVHNSAEKRAISYPPPPFIHSYKVICRQCGDSVAAVGW